MEVLGIVNAIYLLYFGAKWVETDFPNKICKWTFIGLGILNFYCAVN